MSPAIRSTQDNDQAVTGEFQFGKDEFKRIAAILHGDSGISLGEGKVALVYSRLAKRLRLLGLKSFRDYCDLVESQQGASERKNLLTSLTTNVTRFFREPHHFDHLRTHVMPVLADKAKRGGRVRIWSAGCSTGQEPYSIALTVLGVLPDAPSLDFKILATDIDSNVVATAREGRYSDSEFSPVPANLRGRHFANERGEWAASDNLRNWIAFRELNLLQAWPMKGQFDVIFCRNVCIYFEEATQQKLWTRFAEQLTPGGRIYIGHSERANSNLLENDGLTTYRRKGAR